MLQVAKNNRLPRLTCSGLKTVVFPALSTATVRVASSNSMAEAMGSNRFQLNKKNASQRLKDFLNICLQNKCFYISETKKKQLKNLSPKDPGKEGGHFQTDLLPF